MKYAVDKSRQRGSAGVLFAVATTALISLAAVGVDLGRVYTVRARASAAVDAAALAGAQALPGDGALATDIARAYLTKNGLNGAAANIRVDEDKARIRIRASQSVPMTFARVLSIDEQIIAAEAVVRVNALSGVQGAVPLGVRRGDYVFGQSITLKVDARSSEPSYRGNFMALSLGGRGSGIYEDNLANGYGEWLRANDWVDTEPGNMAGPTIRAIESRMNNDPYATWDAVGRRSDRLIRVPVIDDSQPNGRGQFQIVGLAIMFLEGITGNAHMAQVGGRFIRYMEYGEMSPSAGSFGVYVARLES